MYLLYAYCTECTQKDYDFKIKQFLKLGHIERNIYTRGLSPMQATPENQASQPQKA